MKSAVSVVLSLLIVSVSLPTAAFAQSDANRPLASPEWAGGRNGPDIIAAGQDGPGDRCGDVRMTAGEAFVGARKPGNVQRAPRQSLQSVAPVRKSHHIGRWIAIGAAAFGAVMLVWFIHYANCGCG